MSETSRQSIPQDDGNIFSLTIDPRVKSWFLVDSYFPILSLCAVYLYFIKVWGPNYMKNRKPYNLKTVIIFYNIFQILTNMLLAMEILQSGLWGDYNIICQPADTSSPKGLRMARVFWFYFISRLIDFLDTVIFTLRKKKEQATFLHIYHHLYTVNKSWLIVRYLPGGQAALTLAINCVVHTIMYTYYLLAILGPKVQKYLWWKKYITTIQLIQFFVSFIHIAIGVWSNCCKAINLIGLVYLPNLFFFIYLFSSFYKKTYVNDAKTHDS